MKTLLLLPCLCAMIFFAVSCRSNYPPVMPLGAENTDEIEVRRNVQFADLPVPQGFKFNRKASGNFQGSALRGGTVIYDGIWNVAEASEWYRQEMLKTGWEFTDISVVNDYDIRHRYVKANETAKVRIWRPKNLLRVEIDVDKQ